MNGAGDRLPPLELHLSLSVRRALFGGLSLALFAIVASLAWSVTAGSSPGPLDWLLLILFLIIMAWEAVVTAQLLLGLGIWLGGDRARSSLDRQARSLQPVSTGRSRTAVLIPIFDEDVDAVAANVVVIRRSVACLGPSDDLAIHVLSDTRDPDTAAREAEVFGRLAAGSAPGPAVVYRHRPSNAGRKAGNVAEFLDRCGDTYDFAVVLDADSLMSGATIRRLIRLMEENGRVGLIQTISYATNRHTLFARIQQFAVRVYAPLSLLGMGFWQGGHGNYWGHNAILRCRPFRDHCRLPVLTGRPPFGGEILCHDVVEAALMGRAGWEVRLLSDVDGTWEEMPTNTVDLMGRERRWCQGNLQHARVLGIPGLTLGSRLHIVMGIGGYLTAPLWWAFLLLGAVRVLFDPDPSLGILAYGWTEPGPVAAALFAAVALFFVVPRAASLLRVMSTPALVRGFGGARAFLASVAMEQLYWVLLGPILSLTNALFVVQTVAGRVVPWLSQPRADRPVSWREAVAVHAVGLPVGAFLATAAFSAESTGYGVWAGLTAAALLLSPALTVWASREELGSRSQGAGLFLTCDDTEPAPELVQIREGMAQDPAFCTTSLRPAVVGVGG